MPITKAIVEVFINSFRQDLYLTGVKVEFKRQGTPAPENIIAHQTSERLRSHFGGPIYDDLFHRFIQLSNELSTKNLFTQDKLGEHAWLLRYAPIFTSELMTRMIKKHQDEYNYTDLSEIFLQTATVFILAYHSDADLFTKDPVLFEALSNTWLEVLLTLNCKQAPGLKLKYPGFVDHPIYSTLRNLILFKESAETYYVLSSAFAESIGTNKWINRVRAFESLLAIVPSVVDDSDHLRCRFHAAINHLQKMNENSSQYTPSPEPSEEKNVEIKQEPAKVPHSEKPPLYDALKMRKELAKAGVYMIAHGVKTFFEVTSTQAILSEEKEPEDKCCISAQKKSL